jgi:hypothetical protein
MLNVTEMDGQDRVERGECARLGQFLEVKVRVRVREGEGRWIEATLITKIGVDSCSCHNARKPFIPHLLPHHPHSFSFPDIKPEIDTH